MRVFLDTNILLDVLAKRRPFYDDAAAIWTLAEQRTIVGLISAVSLTNIFYIVRKLESRTIAMKALRQLRQVFAISSCDEKVIDNALQMNLKDFEDAVQLVTAVRARSTCLVTRIPRNFTDAPLPILTPIEFLAQQDVEGPAT